MRKYTGIEVLRVVCACMIPLLHIGLYGNGVYYLQQYVARLGVPFFFAVSGMFLSQSIRERGKREAWEKYSKKNGRIFLVWLAIYSPLLILSESFSIKEILFRTPAFLWYVGSILVASVPFCFAKNRKALFIIAGVLYIVGTLFGDTYKWLTGGMPAYEQVFITTRNGLFFALPLMLVGEMVWQIKKRHLTCLIGAAFLLIAEITIVGVYIEKDCDRSMYLMMPAFILLAIRAVMDWNPAIRCTYLGGLSSAIYLMQYGIITVGYAILKRLSMEGVWVDYGILILVLIIPIIFYSAVKETKVAKILF